MYKKIMIMTGLLSVCSFASAQWAALATNNTGSWGLIINAQTEENAMARALKDCQKGDRTGCKIEWTTDEDLYFATAKTMKTHRLTLGVGKTNSEAWDEAMNACKKIKNLFGDTCFISWSNGNGKAKAHTYIGNKMID